MAIRTLLSKDSSVESFNKAVHAINISVAESKKELDDISNIDIAKIDTLSAKLQNIEKILYICNALIDNYGRTEPYTFRDL